MKFLSTILVMVFLTGCAQWQAMDRKQKEVVVATAVAGLIIGYYANDGDGNNAIPEPVPHDHHHGHGHK